MATKMRVSRKSDKGAAHRAGWKVLLAPRIFGRQLPWYWMPIALLVLVVLTHVQIRLGIKATALQLAEVNGNLGPGIFRDVDYDFDGTLRIRDIAYQPVEETQGVHIGEVVIEPPGIWWVVQQALARERNSGRGDARDYPPTRSITLRLQDVEWGDYYLGYAIPRMDWTGSYTGALFEAEGCPEDGFWSHGDLSGRLKLDPGDGEIEIKFEVVGERGLVRTVHIGHAGLSELTMTSTYQLPEPAERFLDVAAKTWRTTSTRWELVDHGFIGRRNAFCAAAAGIDVETFVDRHLRSVERIVASRGSRPSRELLDTYADYARNGGTLVFQTNLGSGRAWEDYAKYGFEGLLAGISATLTVGDKTVPYLLSEIPSQPLPDDYGSTWALLMAESGRGGDAPASTDRTRAPMLRPAEAGADLVDTPAGAGPAAATAESAPAAAPIAASEPIEKLVGRRVEILLEGNRKLRGTLESLDVKTLGLRIRIGGGYAQMTLERGRVLSSRRL